MFRRKTTLSPSHYAGKWAIPEEDQRNDLELVNDLGYEYAIMPDSPEKEEKLLHLLELFHGYLMKYVVMIVRGTIPPVHTRAGKDAKELLRTLTPKNRPNTKEQVNETCKMLHLAFKGATTEEIYDTLAFCFMRAARKYDPFYANKAKRVYEAIYNVSEFSAATVEDRVGFDSTGILRSFVRKGYLASITGKKKVIGYRRGENWPIPDSFFESGPVGFVYMLQLWFRYYFNEYVIQRMSELESNEGLLQLDRNGEAGIQGTGFDELVAPHSEGNCVTQDGKFRFMADRSLMDLVLDISEMNLSWVASTDDKLFKDLEPAQRMLLYLHFHEEQSWKQIARTLGCSFQTAQKRMDEILTKLRWIADIHPDV